MTQSPKVSIPSIVDKEITLDYSHPVQNYELFFTVLNNSYKLGRRSIEYISVPHEIYLYAPQNIFVYAAEYSAICNGKQCYIPLYIDLFAERRDSGDGMALYGAQCGILRVVVRHTTGHGASSQYFFQYTETRRHRGIYFIRVNPCNPCQKEWEVTGGRYTLRPYNHAVCTASYR